jgi:SAM-dependent methyltransferase
MNRWHRRFCTSDRWLEQVQERLLPATFGAPGLDLRGRLLELGPGPGATTQWFLRRGARVTAVDIDAAAVEKLEQNVPGVTVQLADAGELPYADGTFDVVASCTMLHHVRGVRHKDRLVREAARVLAPDGWFCGFDTPGGIRMRLVHLGDDYDPVDPEWLHRALHAAGLVDVSVHTSARLIRFRGRRP